MNKKNEAVLKFFLIALIDIYKTSIYILTASICVKFQFKGLLIILVYGFQIFCALILYDVFKASNISVYASCFSFSNLIAVCSRILA